MKTSETSQKVMKAIFNVQQTVPVLKRDATGSTGGRNYKYTPLDKVWEACSASLKAEGLAIMQSPTATSENGSYGDFFQTTIYHIESGEWVSETSNMKAIKDDPQAFGSAVTYYRRYMLVSMLGLITMDDSDATEHKLATAQQKAQIVGAVKQIFPELNSQADIISTIQNIIGKHPSYIREDEAPDAIALIKAFTANSIES